MVTVEVRTLAERFGVRPTKQLGQNFVHDGNTVRRIVSAAGVGAGDTVLEVGPGLGSLTLALLDVVDQVVAVEEFVDADMTVGFGNLLHVTLGGAFFDGDLELLS